MGEARSLALTFSLGNDDDLFHIFCSALAPRNQSKKNNRYLPCCSDGQVLKRKLLVRIELVASIWIEFAREKTLSNWIWIIDWPFGNLFCRIFVFCFFLLHSVCHPRFFRVSKIQGNQTRLPRSKNLVPFTLVFWAIQGTMFIACYSHSSSSIARFTRNRFPFWNELSFQNLIEKTFTWFSSRVIRQRE